MNRPDAITLLYHSRIQIWKLEAKVKKARVAWFCLGVAFGVWVSLGVR